ncbi:hypothetical protein D1835_11870 [Enterococcus asini]|nr:hypothetical protein [Enterococcus asini]
MFSDFKEIAQILEKEHTFLDKSPILQPFFMKRSFFGNLLLSEVTDIFTKIQIKTELILSAVNLVFA